MLTTYVRKLRLSINQLCHRYTKCREGIAAMEFALIFPIYILIFYSIAEINNYNLQERRGSMAADFAVEYLSRDDDDDLTAIERMNALDIWDIVNPTGHMAYDSRSNIRTTAGFSRSFAGIEFVPTPTGCIGTACTFTPDVQWTFYWYGNSGTTSPTRIKCSMSVVANNMELNGANIHQGMLGRSAAIMGAYTNRYKPLLNTGIMDEHDIQHIVIRKTRGDVALQHPSHQGGQQC